MTDHGDHLDLSAARPILGKEDSVRERPVSDGMIQTTRGPMTEKQAKQESPLNLWIGRYREAHAERIKAEERAEKAEEALARQKQINALALDMLTDADLLKLTEMVKEMDKEVTTPTQLDAKHEALAAGNRTSLTLSPATQSLLSPSPLDDSKPKRGGGHYHEDGTYHEGHH